MSVKYFCKIFKEETGETFVSYLTELRLKEAEKLLKTTELKTYEIAERTGFSDYHHFCKTFKKSDRKNAIGYPGLRNRPQVKHLLVCFCIEAKM